MKKVLLKSSLTFSIIAMTFASCTHDYLEPQNIEYKQEVSFNKEIIPILTANCLEGSACHVKGGNFPELTTEKAYEQLKQGAFVEALPSAEKSKLYSKIVQIADPMSPEARLSSEELSKILAWIKQGAKNN